MAPTINKLDYLNGSTILTQISGDTRLDFFYDEQGSVIGFKYNNGIYLYKKNLQGDIIGIKNSAGEQTVSYRYDSWGKLLAITGTEAETIGQLNPFRYRGYYYDSESGLYYLNSRYYDAETGRFLNVDSVTDGAAGIIGNNLFVYCANNPVNNCDLSGHGIIKNAIKWIADKVVKPVVKTVKNVMSKVNLTYSKGLSLNCSPVSIWNFNAQGGVSFDTKGNIAIQGTVSGGVTGGSAGASISVYDMKTNAPSIKKLNGPGYQVGGSVGIPIPEAPIIAAVGEES